MSEMMSELELKELTEQSVDVGEAEVGRSQKQHTRLAQYFNS